MAEQTHDLVRSLATVPVSDLRIARAKINTQLKRFVARIDFDRDGLMRVIFGHNGKELPPHPLHKFRTDYCIRFTDDGVEREDPPLAVVRPIFARLGSKLPIKELQQAWDAGRPKRKKT